MKQITLLFFAIFIFTTADSQPLPDSIIKAYHAGSSPEVKGMYLYNYLSNVVSEQNNVLNKALEISAYFKKQKDEVAVDYTHLYFASRLNRQGDYSTGLNMALAVLEKFEKRKDWFGISSALKIVSNCYTFAQNYDPAITYMKRRIPICIAQHNERWLSDAYNDLGAVFAQASMPDSGIVYAQKAVNIDTKDNDVANLVYSLGTLAENYLAKGEFDLALPFLKKALSYDPIKISQWVAAYTYLDLSEAFLGLYRYDSCKYYAHKCIEISDHMGYKEPLLNSYTALYNSYEAIGMPDSSNKYFRLATATKDSIYSTAKTNNIQAISFREQLRQQEIENEKLRAEEERKNNIQYAAIAIGIILFISIFLLLSRSIIVNEKWISFLGILGLLIVFEFINLFLHPYLDKFTGHSPVLMLAILVAIASLLIPLHHRLEHLVKNIMVEKNKKIRLASAKKTIRLLSDERLEGDSM